MITFEYQVLRYLPDRVNEEFVNLGVVVFERNSRQLKAKFLDKTARTSAFFPDINARYLLSTIKFLQAELNNLSKKLWKELPFEQFSSLAELSARVLPMDDSSLIFSEVKTGRDNTIAEACAHLFERVVKKNLADQDEFELHRDREVWSKVYKEPFEKYNVASRLHFHPVKTKNDVLEFDRAWKNGRWNCFETVSFDLTKKDAIKNKVYRWTGKMYELATSHEPVSLYLLSILPKDEELRKFIKRKFDNQDLDKSRVELITEDKAEALAKRLHKEMEAHP